MKTFMIAIAALSTACIGTTAVLAQQARPMPMQGNAPVGQTCLQVNRVSSWKIVNESTLMIKDSAEREFRVALNRNCAPSHFYDKMLFDSFTTSSLGCVGSGDRVKLSNRVGQVERCLVKDVSVYTDAQMRIDQRAALKE